MGHLADTILDNDVVIVVGIIIDTVFYFIAENVKLTFSGAPLIADIRGDIDDLEGSQESIIDTFFQTIGIKRLTKVSDVRLVTGFLGCGRHSQLNGIAEILQNLAPVAIVLSTTTMALIDNHHIEEFGLEQLFIIFGALFANQLLIKGEIHLMGGIWVFLILLVVYLVDGIGEGLEVLFNGLIHQYITVSQIEHLFHQFSLQQTIDDLEGGVGLTRTSCHHEQHTFITTGHSIHRTVDSITLILTGRYPVLCSKVD